MMGSISTGMYLGGALMMTIAFQTRQFQNTPHYMSLESVTLNDSGQIKINWKQKSVFNFTHAHKRHSNELHHQKLIKIH